METNLAAGQRVMVSNGGELKERVYLTTNSDGVYICVHQNDEDKYNAGEYFRVGLWTVLETIPSELGDFSYGQEVLVSNGGVKFQKRIFLGTVGNKILAVHARHTERFNEGGKNIKTALWNTAKPALEAISADEAAERFGIEVV